MSTIPTLAAATALPEPPRTGPGYDWARAYLHPPGCDLSSGFPDVDSSPSGVMVLTDISTVAGNTTSAWNAAFIIPGQPDIGYLCWSWTGNTPPEIGSATPNITNQPQGASFWTNFRTNTTAYRILAKSITIYHIASATTDQGSVCAAQYRPEILTVSTGGSTASPAINSYVHQYSVNPLSQSRISVISPKSMAGQARAGLFMPLRMTSLTLPYQPTHPSVYYISNQDTGTQGALSGDYLAPSSFNDGVAVFSGLDANATFQVKTVTILEFQASFASPLAPLMHPGTPYDLDAIGWASHQAAKAPDVTVAAANDFGKFLESVIEPASELAGLIPGAGPFLRPAIKYGGKAMLDVFQQRRAPKGQKQRANAVRSITQSSAPRGAEVKRARARSAKIANGAGYVPASALRRARARRGVRLSKAMSRLRV